VSRKVLVTGGAGFIGSHLVEALVQSGDDVRVIDNLITGRRENLNAVADRIDWIEGDILNTRLLRQAMQGVEIVFHQAALASVQLSIERPTEVHNVCATGTLNVLEAARASGVRRVVYAGSSSAYGNSAVERNRESDLPAPVSPYAAAKLAGENYCQSYFHSFGLETVCLRYFNVFGPRQDPASPYSAVIPLFITRLLSGSPPIVYGDGLQSRDFTFVANVVQGNLLAATSSKAAGKTINVANGEATSLIHLLQTLEKLLGTSIAPVHQAPRAGEVRHSMADISAAVQYLGYKPLVDFESGLERSIEYYRATAQPKASTAAPA
jgi:UDP-glucose 4-epimerase